MSKPKLLWVGDAACPTGFARATHEILNVVQKEYDVTVLGVNYNGDPHRYDYPIYAANGEDVIGAWRIAWMCDHVQPDVVVLMTDPWLVPYYTRKLKEVREERPELKVVGMIAVDGKNCQGGHLNKLDHCIFWTEFGRDEASLGGYFGPSTIVPLGVDQQTFYPEDAGPVRRKFLGDMMLNDVHVENAFIVGTVNRNQVRKRFDLLIDFFATWITREKIKDAFLFLHVAPTQDNGPDPIALARYHNIVGNVIMRQPPSGYGISEQEMRETYCMFDVAATTTHGEGFGLTSFEAMACGVPLIYPRWSALEELVGDAGMDVECTSTFAHAGIDTIGGVADKEQFIASLSSLYHSRVLRDECRIDGIRRVQENRFRWKEVGRRVQAVLDGVMQRREVPA